MPRRLLELYSGTGSVGRAFAALGWDVVSVDLDPRANATHCCDIAEWDCTCVGEVDVILGFSTLHNVFCSEDEGSQR